MRRLRTAQHRVEHLCNGALLGCGQCLDQFQLLPDLLLRPALLRCGRGRCGVVVNQRIERGLQGLRDHRQQRHRHAPPALLERVHGLLRDAELFGQLHLRDALRLALRGDAAAQGDEEGAFVVGNSHAVRGMSSERVEKLGSESTFLIDPNAQGPQSKLWALLFAVLLAGLARCLRDHGIGKKGSESTFLILDKHKARIAGLVVCGAVTCGY